MFRFIKNVFVVAMSFFSCNSLIFFWTNNKKCKLRPEMINIDSNKPSSYPYNVKISKCSGKCNNINDPYVKLCIPNVAKDVNVKVFNLMSRINETRHKEWHETCECKCWLDESISNNKQRWNNDKYKCECKE